jgi:outer membrane protein OmpA-like peptidoglycan-associated protein
MFRVLSFLVLILLFHPATAQENTRIDSIQLFYNINESQPIGGFQKVDSVFSISKRNSRKIKITGYADFLHDAQYNIKLSQKRADEVKNYILSKIPSAQIVFCKGAGEKYSIENGNSEGEPYQRRVTVVFERSLGPVVKENIKLPVQEEKIKEETEKEESTIEELSKGQSLTLQGLNFEPGRHFITKNSVPVLQKLLTTMQQNPKLKIQVQGHVCCTTGQDDGLDYDTHERKLSENRAKAIYDYLVSKGISSKRLSYKGFGHSKPLYPAEATPEEEQANRRVEILIIEK